MKSLIVHFSDIHLKNDGNQVFRKLDKLSAAVLENTVWADNVVLAFTGDLTFSGKQEEFLIVLDFIAEIVNRVKAACGKEPFCICIPGNHDCDFKEGKSAIRETIIDKVRSKRAAPDEFIEQCCEVQDSFLSFKNALGPTAHLVFDDRLMTILSISDPNYSLVFTCYNTAWISEEKEKPAQLFYPIERYKDQLRALKGDSCISVLHHTYNWFDPENSRELRTIVEATSDFVLTGHEHVSGKWKKDDFEGNPTVYLEGGILQNSDNEEDSGFNVLQLDLELQKYRIIEYRWKFDHYSSSKPDPQWAPCQRSQLLLKRKFGISSEFRAFLADPGAPYNHPRKSKLTLSDIFVFPNMRDLNIDEKRDKILVNDIRNSETLCHTIGGRRVNLLITGESKSGKTALCKTLFDRYYASGYIPVYLDGSEISSSSIEKFNGIVERYFKHQYDCDDVSEFRQLADRKILIVDDFHSSGLNMKHKRMLMQNINQYYPNVVITANELFQLEEMVLKSDHSGSAFRNYERYALIEFGNLLRGRLIETWNLLGAEEFLEDGDLYHRNDQAKSIVDGIVGKNFIPSFPMFILAILQGIEAATPLNLSESSYGHYHEFLILQAFVKIGAKNEEITAYTSYLAELAHYLFVRKTRSLSKNEFLEFHQVFCKAYSLRFPADSYVSSLIRCDLLEWRNGNLRFRYLYFFYFFIAKYLADNIAAPDTINVIVSMCSRLYQDEFANIIMFLTHLSKHPVILDEVLKNSRKIFSKYSAVEFGEDIVIVNDLMDAMPKFVLNDQDIRKYRSEVLETKDQAELLEKAKDPSAEKEQRYDLDEPIPELELISEFNLALKMVQLLGQLIKNYYGALKTDIKFALAEEAYILSLRTLNVFFTIIKDNMNLFVGEIRKIIETKKVDFGSKVDVERISKNFLFNLCYIASYGFFKRTSAAIGSENAAVTFEEVLQKRDTVAIWLIDLAIKLDHFEHFPFKEIQHFKSRIVGNILPLTVLKRMVINYFYMFPTEFRDKQRICALLEIPMSSQRLIDETSKEKKR
jgi:hypothetical protein